MKSLKYIVVIITVVVSFLSCKKDIPQPGDVSALTIVNAIVGSSPLIANFYGPIPTKTYYATALQTRYGSFNEYPLTSGSIPVTVYQTTDTTQTLFNRNVSLQAACTYSLFLSGTNTTNPDAILIQDKLPYHSFTDSATSIRFINLSPGSNPISVNLKGQAVGSEVASLNYKALSGFKSYPATYKISSYVFEFRDANSGNLIASYTMNGINNGTGTNTSTNSVRFKNFTLGLDGVPGGTGSSSQGIFIINNY